MVLLYSILRTPITILMGFKCDFNFPKYRIDLHYNMNVYLFIYLFIHLLSVDNMFYSHVYMLRVKI